MTSTGTQAIRFFIKVKKIRAKEGSAERQGIYKIREKKHKALFLFIELKKEPVISVPTACVCVCVCQLNQFIFHNALFKGFLIVYVTQFMLDTTALLTSCPKITRNCTFVHFCAFPALTHLTQVIKCLRMTL